MHLFNLNKKIPLSISAEVYLDDVLKDSGSKAA